FTLAAWIFPTAIEGEIGLWGKETATHIGSMSIRMLSHLLAFTAVAQNLPCEKNGVIMGQGFPLKLSQREQDARQEAPMRTPKRLYAQQRIIYQPELLTCPHCGDLLVMCNYLAWDKIVQTLDCVLSVASRPGHCPHATC